jgi:hypothetical protein
VLVYGDRSETVDPRAFGEDLLLRSERIAALPAGLARHVALVGALIDAGRLAQGLADEAFSRDGVDDGQELLPQSAAGVLAGAVGASWFGGLGAQVEPPRPLRVRLEQEAPDSVCLREPEGFAFYALYPEAVLEAGAGLYRPGRTPAVIGLRSIGTSLAPLAACAAGGLSPVTLRPAGDPFARRLSVGPTLRSALLEAAEANGVLVVDEGPGASGSSFGALGDWLEAGGVPAERVTYMPSHTGDLGPQASERHRARWRTARKAHARFEDVILPRLPGWVEPIVGPATAPLEDLSGGLWREAAGVDAPAWPEQERRKHRLTTTDGAFLLKFAGLGEIGHAKLARARALHAAGWGVEPLGLAHGFLVERFFSSPIVPAEARMIGIEEAAEYLAVRARLPPPPPGAAPDLLRTMMRRNLSLAGMPEAAALAERLPAPERITPAAVDGRLHTWEWRRDASGRLVKLDALDHCQAHDLLGAQDLAWDVAGAAVEFGLSADDADRLRGEVGRTTGREIDPRSLDFHTFAYLAFQVGWWTLAAQGCEGARAAAQVERYKARAVSWRPAA